MAQLKINAAINVIEAELHQFYHDRGGATLLPHLEKRDNISDFVKYELTDGDSVASITLHSTADGGCKLTFYFNDSDRYAWILGDPVRGVLGKTTILGMTSSKNCEEFCTKFAEYLYESGHTLRLEDSSNGDAPIFEEDLWVQEQYTLDRPVEEIYPEWIDRRKKAGRPELVNPLDSFKKVIYKK
jgi:hypothetical protein